VVSLIRSLVKEHLERLAAGDVNLDDFAPRVIEKARSMQGRYSAFITINERLASEKTPKQQMKLPFSVKDNICTRGLRTTAGSKILDNYVPPFDATAVHQIKNAGGFVIGKTAMDEFGFGTFSTNCAYGAPKNPIDPSRVCGGSSGGAACVAAAAEFPHIAIAQSTGGSITAPAAFTGTVGMTPTYGRVSRWGLIDYANSMDRIGVIGKCVYDAALGLSMIAGYDPLDSTSLNAQKTDYTTLIGGDIRKLRIGVPKEYFNGDGSAAVKKNALDLLQRLERFGVVWEEISLPYTKYAISAYYLIALAEASTNLAKFSGLRYGMEGDLDGNYEEYFADLRGRSFGEEAKRRIILGTYARMSGYRDAYYIKALKVRAKIIAEFKDAFARVNVIATPSMPIIAPRFDDVEKLSPIDAYGMDRMTVPANLAGLPTISVPSGSEGGMPTGVQFIADHERDGMLIALAGACEA
jgi:aspartyl-tRNA(Asn)/glutamyl-tRNA(Gln) amidotransferase subunit A